MTRKMTQPTPEPSPAAEPFSLTISRIIQAPRQRVFEAWTDPQHLQHWWGVRQGYTAPIVEIDLREGGRYRLAMLAPEAERPNIVGGVFREVQPPEKLSFTWTWERGPADNPDWQPAETLVTVEFRDLGDATEVTLTHTGFPEAPMRDEHTNGWSGAIQRLGRYIALAVTAGGVFTELTAAARQQL